MHQLWLGGGGLSGGFVLRDFVLEPRLLFCQRSMISYLTIFSISDKLQDLHKYVNIISSVQSDHSALNLKLSPLSEKEREITHIGNLIIH